MNENHTATTQLLEEVVAHGKQLLHKLLSSLTLTRPPNPQLPLLLHRKATSGMDDDIEDSSAQDGTIMSLHGKGIQLVGEVAYINDGLRQVLSSLTSSSQPRPIIRTRGTSSSSSGYSGNARRAMCASRKAAASNFELNNNNGAKYKAEDATIYFCLRIFYNSANEAEDNWFSIPTWQMPLSTDRFIRPIFKEPGRAVTYHDTPPIAVGPYIFIIHEVEKTNEEEMPSRSVFYRDTRNKSKDG
ncbi:hypothetical protein DM860_008812 [Cuscuta australis]|uniref:Uncharacterized protein n=1 Tax=Cuscuta australis TaxID=267555 RepID=A0A328D6Q3_9ASTE|nr:hypothetical protein DM860_008812 [Cuscuta australis]